MTETRKMQFEHLGVAATDFIGKRGSLFFDPDSSTLRIGDGSTPGGNPISAGTSGLPTIVVSFSNPSQGGNNSIGTIPDSGLNVFGGAVADVLYTVSSGTTIFASGVIVMWNNNSANIAGLAATGANGVRFQTSGDHDSIIGMAWATNDAGTSYSAPFSGNSSFLCLVEGTLITLADGYTKRIEYITYDDELLVWDFDSCAFATSKPLWIKKGNESPEYNLLTFEDGTSLRTVGQHRFLNKETGEFTYPLHSPLGTTTFTHEKKSLMLTEKRVVKDDIGSFNIITDYHMNLFANGILTSNSFNNLFPIMDMKFVKIAKPSLAISDQVFLYDMLGNSHKKFYTGMRLSEQFNMKPNDIKKYIDKMIATQI